MTVRSRPLKTFVYVVCGDDQLASLNTSLRHLKRRSRADIIVLAAGCHRSIEHDQVLPCEPTLRGTNRETSIRMKVNLHRLVDVSVGEFCYLDTDVIAVADGVDRVFTLKHGPVTFAPDHVPLALFSRHAVRCRCTGGACSHLAAALLETFGVVISDAAWQHWNGGVFLFDAGSAEFLDTWSAFTERVLGDPYWYVRDQGALVATVWHLGLERNPTLPVEANYIVDRFRHVPSDRRASADPGEWSVDSSYSLNNKSGKVHPFFVHLINGGVGRTGWGNWDDIERLREVSHRDR
jgi:hypothetical protein